MKRETKKYIAGFILIFTVLLVFAVAYDFDPPGELSNNYSGKMISFENATFGLRSCYPEDWYVSSGEYFIDIVPEKNDLIWEPGGSIYPNISIIVIPALSLRGKGIVSATGAAKQQLSIAQNLANEEPLYIGTVVQPVTTLMLGEREAAIFEVEHKEVDLVGYRVLTKVSYFKVVSISFSTQRQVDEFSVDELRSIVNAIAHCTSLLDDK